MKPPPPTLQGAQILHWTGTDAEPFYYLKDGKNVIVIAGMAIGKYDYGECFFLFTCDPDWNVINDRDATSLQEARHLAESLASHHLLVWHQVSKSK
jgi:hypothetical protein